MNRTTEQLILDLAASARPYARAGKWLALSLVYVAAVMVVMPPRDDLSAKLTDPLFITEELAALATGVAAAVAAFVTIVPGASRRWVPGRIDDDLEGMADHASQHPGPVKANPPRDRGNVQLM